MTKPIRISYFTQVKAKIILLTATGPEKAYYHKEKRKRKRRNPKYKPNARMEMDDRTVLAVE